MLSLALLLLGFFALLTAMTERHEARAAAVLSSLVETFGPVVGGAGEGVPYSSRAGEALALAAIEGDVRAAFETIAEVTTVALDEDGAIAEVRVPAAALFVGDSPVPRPAVAEVVAGLAAALAGADVEIMVSVRVGASSSAPRRALALAEGLIGQGMAPALIEVGGDPAMGSDIAFGFAIRPDDEARP